MAAAHFNQVSVFGRTASTLPNPCQLLMVLGCPPRQDTAALLPVALLLRPGIRCCRRTVGISATEPTDGGDERRRCSKEYSAAQFLTKPVDFELQGAVATAAQRGDLSIINRERTAAFRFLRGLGLVS